MQIMDGGVVTMNFDLEVDSTAAAVKLLKRAAHGSAYDIEKMFLQTRAWGREKRRRE